MLLAWEMSSGGAVQLATWQYAALALAYLALVAAYLRFVSKTAFKPGWRAQTRVAAILSLGGFAAGLGMMLWIFVLPQLLRG